MKINVGDIVSNAVHQQKLKNITQIAGEIGITRVTLNSILKSDQMEVKYIIAIGKSLQIDFSKFFKELSGPNSVNIVEDPGELYRSNIKLREKYETLLEENKDLQNRYIEMMEKYIKSKKRM